MSTLAKTKRLMKRAPTGAGRQLLRIMRDDNRLNVTEKDSEELFDQFMSFRMQATEFEDVELYLMRLKTLKHDIETAKKDPQPISDRFHRRIYVAGLRCYPLYDSALNDIPKLEEQTLDYIHSRMVTACGKTKRLIQAMHAKQAGGAAVTAAISQITPTPAPTATPPSPSGKSLNDKAHMPNCQQYMLMRRCALGHKNAPTTTLSNLVCRRRTGTHFKRKPKDQG